MFQNSNVADSVFGAAIKAAFLAMKSTGGKLLVFQSGVFPSQLELVSSINLTLYLALGIVLVGKMKNC
ncbi:hypothetical protein AB3S75_013087 [Citrus x aurantiifolia]